MERISPLELHVLRAAHFAFCEGEQGKYEPPVFINRAGRRNLYLLDVKSSTQTFDKIRKRELVVSVSLRGGETYPFKITFVHGRITELDMWDERVEMITTEDFHVDSIEMKWFDLGLD